MGARSRISSPETCATHPVTPTTRSGSSCFRRASTPRVLKTLASAFSRTEHVLRRTTDGSSPSPARPESLRLELPGHPSVRRGRSSGSPRSPHGSDGSEDRGASFPDPSRQGPRLAGLLGEIREVRLRRGELLLRVFEILASMIPGRLDHPVPILPVVPRIEVVLELLGRGRELRDLGLVVGDALARLRRDLLPFRLGGAAASPAGAAGLAAAAGTAVGTTAAAATTGRGRRSRLARRDAALCPCS